MDDVKKTLWTRIVADVEYLTDVLVRLQTHPASRLDELLPRRWKPPPPSPPS